MRKPGGVTSNHRELRALYFARGGQPPVPTIYIYVRARVCVRVCARRGRESLCATIRGCGLNEGGKERVGDRMQGYDFLREEESIGACV